MQFDLGLFSLSLATLLVFFDIAVRLAAIFIIPNNRKPSEAMAWLVTIFFVPFMGFLAFLLFGHSKLSKKRQAKQRAINMLIYEKTMNREIIGQEIKNKELFMSLVHLNAKLGALPLVGGNSLKIITDYEDSISKMTVRINQAKDFVHVEFYIMSLDATSKEFINAIINAQKRGVKVRVLLDHVGSLQYPGYKPLLRLFKTHNIDFHLMLPVLPLKGKFQRPDLRNHRKLLVVDGKYGFVGSQNIIDSSYNKKKNIKKGLHWKELMLECEGLIVDELETIFIADWHAETDELLESRVKEIGTVDKQIDKNNCQLVPSGPGFEGENNLKLFVALIYAAKRKIIITSPYFVPDESMLVAITTAAERGLEVELYVSEIGDQFLVYHAQRSYYEALLKAGVKIFLYEKPTVLHAKHFSIDDEIAVIGTSNMDMRSFNLNLEISMLVHSAEFVKKLRQVERDYKDNSRELTLEVWSKRPRRHKFIDNAARLTSSLQ